MKQPNLGIVGFFAIMGMICILALTAICVKGCVKDRQEKPEEVFSEPSPKIPDPKVDRTAYKNITQVNCYDNSVCALYVEDKKVHWLEARSYEVILDAKENPWWEEITTQHYSYFFVQNKWILFDGRKERHIVIHIKQLSDVAVHRKN